jgi:hypothetical protein
LAHISRQSNYVNGEIADADAVEAEFDQLILAVNDKDDRVGELETESYKVKADTSDENPNYLYNKLSAGGNITIQVQVEDGQRIIKISAMDADGAVNHEELGNLESANCHPMSAITGLVTTLANINGLIEGMSDDVALLQSGWITGLSIPAGTGVSLAGRGCTVGITGELAASFPVGRKLKWAEGGVDKYGIVNACEVSAGITYVAIVCSSTITAYPYGTVQYSDKKAPSGFPIDVEDWVFNGALVTSTYTNPVTNGIYPVLQVLNLRGGSWDIEFSIAMAAGFDTGVGDIDLQTDLVVDDTIHVAGCGISIPDDVFYEYSSVRGNVYTRKPKLVIGTGALSFAHTVKLCLMPKVQVDWVSIDTNGFAPMFLRVYPSALRK